MQHRRKTRLTVKARLNSKSAAQTVAGITEILTRLGPAMRRAMAFASRDIAALSPASQRIMAQNSLGIFCTKTRSASRRSSRAPNRWRPVALTLRRLCVPLGRSCFTKSPAGKYVAKRWDRECERQDQTLVAAPDRPGRPQRRRDPGHRHDVESYTAKVRRLQITR